MSNPITDARLALADRLKLLGYQVYAFPTEQPAPPCIQIFTAGDWLLNPRLGNKRDVRFGLRLSAPAAAGNEQASMLLEQMVWDTIGLVVEAEIIQAPKLDLSATSACYVVDLVTLVGT